MDDSELIEASRSGDRAAYGALFGRHRRMVEAVAFAAAGERAIVDDVVQDTFVAAWQTLDRLHDATRLRPWLCGIARNVARKTRRRHGRTQVLREVAGEDSPFETTAEREREREVRAALAGLTARYREPLVLFYFEQCTVRELAATLAIREDAAMQRLSRGRQQLGVALATRLEESIADRPARLAQGWCGSLAERPRRNAIAAVFVVLALARSRAALAGTAVRSFSCALARRWRIAGTVLATIAVAVVVARAVEKSERVAAAHTAHAEPASLPAAEPPATPDDGAYRRKAESRSAPQQPALPTPGADRELVYASIVVAGPDPRESCARAVHSLVPLALNRSTVIELDDDGRVVYEDREVERIADQIAGNLGDTCATPWPEIYVVCDGTAADVLAGNVSCYPYSSFD